MKYVIGNWKMNPVSRRDAKKLLEGVKDVVKKLKDTTVVVAVPSPYWSDVRGVYGGKKLALASQNINAADAGAHTGEVSVQMAKEFGVTYAIIGHSERRNLGETDGQINQKVKSLLSQDMRPVVCFGESERDTKGAYLSVLEGQIKAICNGVHRSRAEDMILAYEPIWAIGAKAKRPITTHELHEIVIYIRKMLTEIYDSKTAKKIPLIYGGSVNPRNAEALITEGYVDGFLPGRASLSPESFNEIVSIVEKHKN